MLECKDPIWTIWISFSIPVASFILNMSSRRKRAAPVRMDEETKEKLNWNMHEHRRTEGDFEDLEAFPQSSVSYQPDPVPDVSNAEVLGCSSLLPAEKEEEEEAGSSMQDFLKDTTELNVPSVFALGSGWKALIGEFELYPKVPVELANVTFCLQQTGDVLSINLTSTSSEELTSCPVECSFGGLLLEDLDWLQKRKVIQLCHLSGEGSVKVFVCGWRDSCIKCVSTLSVKSLVTPILYFYLFFHILE